MHWTVILFLISLIINGIIAYLLHNSHNGYEEGDFFKMPLILWILIGISTIIPVLNTIASIFYIVFTIRAYADGDVELNDNFWLTKEY